MIQYLKIARPDHWFKNIFMLPGIALALIIPPHDEILLYMLSLGLASTCLLASANYVINEYLDAEYDQYHPVKKERPSVAGLIKPAYVALEYCLLIFVGLALAWVVGKLFFTFSVLLLVMGILYNVSPIRLKDRIYVDVLSESLNNPIRFFLGWHIVEKVYLPPSSIILAYWFGGAFLMAVKRYAEYSKIGDPVRAGLYRRSFQFYSKNSLLQSMFFYAMNAALFLGVFLVKYRIEFLVCFPFISLLFAWYAGYGLTEDAAAENPEKLYRKWKFLLYMASVVVLIFVLFMVDIPGLKFLMERHIISGTGILSLP